MPEDAKSRLRNKLSESPMDPHRRPWEEVVEAWEVSPLVIV